MIILIMFSKLHVYTVMEQTVTVIIVDAEKEALEYSFSEYLFYRYSSVKRPC